VTRTRSTGRFVLAGIAALGTIACGPSPATSQPPASAAQTVAPTAAASQTPSASVARSPSPAPASPAVMVDPGLLEVLPAEIEDATLVPDAATAAQIAVDPFVAQTALGVAVAIVVAPGPSDTEDVAVSSVIRLQPDVFDEAFYQEWRDGYNDSACEVADGVATDDEQQISGRTVYIATCAGGTQAYHTYLEDQGFIVSITSTGPRAFGELIMAGLAG
jgi:hypothetical protein